MLKSPPLAGAVFPKSPPVAGGPLPNSPPVVAAGLTSAGFGASGNLTPPKLPPLAGLNKASAAGLGAPKRLDVAGVEPKSPPEDVVGAFIAWPPNVPPVATAKTGFAGASCSFGFSSEVYFASS